CPMVISLTTALQGLLRGQVQQDVEFFISLAWHAQQVEGCDNDTKNCEVDAQVENHRRGLVSSEDLNVQRGQEGSLTETCQTRQRCQGNTRTNQREVWPTNLCPIIGWCRQVHQGHAAGTNKCRDESAAGFIVTAEKEQYGQSNDDWSDNSACCTQEYCVFKCFKDRRLAVQESLANWCQAEFRQEHGDGNARHAKHGQ